MTQQRSIVWIAAMPVLLLGVVAVLAIASPAPIPHAFTPGTVADANQVNQNFQSVKTAVDDNDSRITAIEGGTTATPLDADTLAGLAANQLVRASYAQGVGFLDDFTAPVATPAVLVGTTATAPAAGVLLMWGSVEAEWDFTSAGGSTYVSLGAQFRVDGALVGTGSIVEINDGSNEPEQYDRETLTIFAAAPVAAGSRLVELTGHQVDTDDYAYILRRSVTTLFVPFGDAGTQGVLKPSFVTGPNDSNAIQQR